MVKQPKIRHLLDAPKDDWYVLEEPILFLWQEAGHVRIPAGYISDGCSVPSLLWVIFPPLGAFFVPGLVHDYLYEKKTIMINRPLESTKVYFYTITRKEADAMFLRLLNYYSPKTRKRNYIRYIFVRAFGWYNWPRVRYVDIYNYKQ